MKKFRYRLLDNSDNLIFCNLLYPEKQKLDEIESISQLFSDRNIRAGKLTSTHGTVYAFSKDKDYVKSSNKFKSSIKVVSESLEMLNGIIQDKNLQCNRSTSRLIHNLTSHNAHNIQEIYSLIPQENVSKKMGEQISVVEKIVLNESKVTAVALLRIAKNNAAMKAEFAVFRKLFDKNPQLKKINHNVHKVLMNIIYLFFPDFTDKNVNVIVGENSETAYFDYEVLHVAFYHMIENAAKYIKPNSDFLIEIKKGLRCAEIYMDMISIEIGGNEKDKIFEEGFSGMLSKKLGKAGQGIGMCRVKEIMELSSGSIEVHPQKDTTELVMGITYQRNIFIMKIPIK